MLLPKPYLHAYNYRDSRHRGYEPLRVLEANRERLILLAGRWGGPCPRRSRRCGRLGAWGPCAAAHAGPGRRRSRLHGAKRFDLVVELFFFAMASLSDLFVGFARKTPCKPVCPVEFPDDVIVWTVAQWPSRSPTIPRCRKPVKEFQRSGDDRRLFVACLYPGLSNAARYDVVMARICEVVACGL